jgi:hypothetical protein
MRKLFHQALTVMGNAFRRIEQQVPSPQQQPWKDGFVFRYVEQSVEQALVQKLARVISGLHAVDLLLMHGFVQEQGVLHRTMDELNEDIMFLAAARTNDTVTDLHKQYLESFYAEEFDNPKDPVALTQKRHMVPRRKVRAYITRVLGKGINPSKAADVGETISKAYSGFVHAASPQIMDMCGGNPPKFYLTGMLGTSRIREHVDDAWNYFYRGLVSVAVVAKAFGDKPLVDSLYSYIAKFEQASGTNFSSRAKTET